MSRRDKSAEISVRHEANAEAIGALDEEEKPLSPSSKCISSQKRLKYKRRKLFKPESHKERKLIFNTIAMNIQQLNVRPTRAKISTQNTLNTFLSIQLAVKATDSVFVLAIGA